MEKHQRVHAHRGVCPYSLQTNPDIPLWKFSVTLKQHAALENNALKMTKSIWSACQTSDSKVNSLTLLVIGIYFQTISNEIGNRE